MSKAGKKVARKSPRNTLSPEVVAFLKRSGAIEKAQQEVFKAKIRKHLGATLGEILDAARKEGWLEQLRQLKLGELLPPARKTRSKAARGSVKSEVLKYLKKNRNCTAGVIAKALNVPSTAVSGALQTLKEDKKAKVTGNRKAARWNAA